MSPRVEEVATDVFRVQLPLAFPSPNEVSVFVLKTEDGPILVDTAMAGSEAALDEALRDVGATRPVMVVVTHEHPDHIGLAGRFDAPTLIHPLTGQLVEMFRGLDGAVAAEFADRFWMRDDDIPDTSMFAPFAAAIAWPTRVRHLSDGDRLPGGWRAVWTPGHAPGHLCLHHGQRRLLIVGDHVLPGYTPHVGMDPHHADPVGTYLDSLHRVLELPVDLVLPSHGEPFTDLAAGVGALQAHHAQRLDAIERELRAPRSVREVAAAVFRDAGNPVDAMMASLEAAAHLVHLERAGRAVRLPERRWGRGHAD